MLVHTFKFSYFVISMLRVNVDWYERQEILLEQSQRTDLTGISGYEN